MLNAVIAGNIGNDAQTRQAGQTNVTGFNVAVEQRGRDGKKTQWVRCSLWGRRGDTLAQYLTKGSKVCVAGELSTSEYEGRTSLELNVSDVTLLGGRQDGQSSGYGGSQQSNNGGQGAGGFGGGDLDDEIPFAPEARA